MNIVKFRVTMVLKQPYTARYQFGRVEYEAESITSTWKQCSEDDANAHLNRTRAVISSPGQTVYIIAEDQLHYSIPTDNIAYMSEEWEWLEYAAEESKPEAEGAEDGGAAGPEHGADGGPPAGQLPRS